MAVAISVETVMVFADDGHGTGVVGAVAAAAFAVVVGCVRVEAGAAVVGVAFARFRFFGFGGFGFFACFGSFARAFSAFMCRSFSCTAPRRLATFPGSDSALYAMAALRSGSSGFQGNLRPRFPLGA